MSCKEIKYESYIETVQESCSGNKSYKYAVIVRKKGFLGLWDRDWWYVCRDDRGFFLSTGEWSQWSFDSPLEEDIMKELTEKKIQRTMDGTIKKTKSEIRRFK